jgi:hypothetical protein
MILTDALTGIIPSKIKPYYYFRTFFELITLLRTNLGDTLATDALTAALARRRRALSTSQLAGSVSKLSRPVD